MNKKWFTKLILIIVIFLMIFSVLGQFMVSAQENDSGESSPNLEINEESQESTPAEILDEDVDVIIEVDDSSEKEDNKENISPYNVTSTNLNSFNVTSASISTVHNPDIPKEKVEDYQVVSISDKGQISVIDYFSDFNSALAEMNKEDNRAIRHSKSFSPMKFIAAKRAILQSVTHRVNGNRTMIISNNITSTYIDRANEMAYFGTKSYNPKTGLGKVEVGINGFKGDAEIKQLDIIPMVYVENVLSIELSGSKEVSADSTLYNSIINVAPAQSFYKISQLSNGKKQVEYYSENLNRPSKSSRQYYKFRGAVGLSEEKWMKDGAVYYSWDGVTFYHDRDYTDLAGTYYNYYQYLPLRSATNITANELDAYFNKLNKSNSKMKDVGNIFIENGANYGLNPLLIYAMAAHESGWGTSKIAREYNNLFGWNAYDSDPSAATGYGSIASGVKLQMSINIRGYLDVTFRDANYRKDSRYFGAHLGNRGSGLNKKYASDPYWGMKISQTAYEIDASSGLKDYKKYKLALVNDPNEYVVKNTSVKKTNEADKAVKSEVYYNFKSNNNYMNNVTTTVVKGNDNFYKTQTFASIDENSNIINITSNTGPIIYNWTNSVGYIKKDKVTLLHDEVSLPNQFPTVKQYPEEEIKPDPNPEPTPEPKPDPKPEQFILGDVNGDKVIDIFDYVAVANHILKRNILSEKQIKSADINKDGVVDIFDYVAIANHILGKTIISGGN